MPPLRLFVDGRALSSPACVQIRPLIGVSSVLRLFPADLHHAGTSTTAASSARPPQPRAAHLRSTDQTKIFQRGLHQTHLIFGCR